jgi:hypothetical protein
VVTSSESADLRTIWRRLALIAKVVPEWVLQLIGGAIRGIFLLFYRRSLRKGNPVHQGIGLWTEGVNSDLHLQRLKSALDLLGAHAPVYLRWFRRRFESLLISQLFMIMRRTTFPDYRARLVMVHPYTAWKVSPEQLALYLAAEATRGRFGPRFSRRRLSTTRVNRRALKEMVACARMLPSGGPLVAKWEQYLADFDRHFPEAAA